MACISQHGRCLADSHNTEQAVQNAVLQHKLCLIGNADKIVTDTTCVWDVYAEWASRGVGDNQPHTSLSTQTLLVRHGLQETAAHGPAPLSLLAVHSLTKTNEKCVVFHMVGETNDLMMSNSLTA